MENIVAVSINIDDSHKAIIYPSGTNPFQDCNTEVVEGKTFYLSKEHINKQYFEYKLSDLNINPFRLKETVSYCCRIESSDKEKNYYPHIVNEDNKLVKLGNEDDRIIFQFINYLGKSRIYFENSSVFIDFEVVPDKINYEDDYVKLTEAIADECSTLLLDYTSPTSLSFLQDSTRESNILEQFIFLRKFCFSDNLESLFASIKRNPDRILIKEEELKPFGNGIPSEKFFSNPFTYSRGWIKTSRGNYSPSEVATIHKYDSYDTPANRFIKFALLEFNEVCKKVLQKVLISGKENDYLFEANKLITQIDSILSDSFFDDIGKLEIMPVNNQVLEKREGYSQIFNAFSMIDLALKLDWKDYEDFYSGESKNTALLYEYWLFFELRKIIHELSGKDNNSSHIEPYNQFISDENGLTISLQQGKPSIQSFSFEQEGITVNLYYNRTFSPAQFNSSVYWGSYSRPFRPDYTLAIFASKYKRELDAIKAGEVSYVHFDAKYRIQDLTQFINTDKKQISEAFLEKTEDQSSEEENEKFVQEKNDEIINTYKRGDLLKMHTYNDAIRRTVGSYVLYPGNENNSKRSEQSAIYDELLPGVGAFAIRPGNENAGQKVIKDFIRKIIEFKANEASRKARTTYFENMVIQTPGIETEQTVKDDNSDLTMVGYVREDYYSYLKKNRFLPKDENDNSIEEGTTFFFYFRAIKDGKVYTLHNETSKAKYLRFTLKKLVDIKIKVGQKFEELEPWKSKILSIKLVSKNQLKEILGDYSINHDFHADYYYLVEASFLHSYEGGIVAICTDENEIISPYSPKIVKLSEGSSEF